MRVDSSSATQRGPFQGDEQWHLADERDFLRRSLEDARREHEAGDLSDDDFELLRARDTTRLAEVEAALAAHGPDGGDAGERAPTATRPGTPVAEDAPEHAGQRSRRGTDAPRTEGSSSAADSVRPPMALWRRIGIVGACGLIVLGAVLLVVHFVQARQPGQASSGSITVSQAQQIEQQLQQALALNNSGNTKGALELYDKVLSEDPSNPAALAYAGYLQWEIGSQSHVASLVRIGRAEIQTAVKDAPSYDEAHLFYGLVLENQDHNDKAAVAQFNDFVADGAPQAEESQVEPLVLGAYEGADAPVPAAFTGGASTTTTPSTGSAP